MDGLKNHKWNYSKLQLIILCTIGFPTVDLCGGVFRGNQAFAKRVFVVRQFNTVALLDYSDHTSCVCNNRIRTLNYSWLFCVQLVKVWVEFLVFLKNYFQIKSCWEKIIIENPKIDCFNSTFINHIVVTFEDYITICYIEAKQITLTFEIHAQYMESFESLTNQRNRKWNKMRWKEKFSMLPFPVEHNKWNDSSWNTR